MKRLTIVLPAIAMLAACNSKPTVHLENASVDQVEAATGNVLKIEPGKWETSIAILSIDGPDLPPQTVAAMKQRMSGQKVETCITPEEADKPTRGMLGMAKSCTFETFEVTGGKFSGTLVCKSSLGAPSDMRATMSGNFASTSYDVTTATTMHMPPIPERPAGGDITTTNQITAKRIGACDAPKAG